MPADRFDVAVIGAGIVGLATARELTLRDGSRRVVVLEKEDGPARHQTGHNSGVIHSGVYYRPGTLKARLCVEGRRLLTAYCEEKRIAYEWCGKLVVAAEEAEVEGLEELRGRGEANGIEGLRMLDTDGIRRIEPHVVGVRALHVPSAGIVDYVAVARSLERDVRGAGVEVRYRSDVGTIATSAEGVTLSTPRGTVLADRVIACAGLWSDRVARAAGAAAEPRVIPFRGDYYVLRPERRELIRGLVYRVPDPRFPFLGVHFTRRMDGAVWLGPNAVLAFARDGYRRTDVNVAELFDALRDHGFQTLARRFWRTGLAELYRDYAKPAFLAELRRYVPELTGDDLLPGPSGVRAQALSPTGELIDDFVFDRLGRFLNVRNAPSPAATSSLAIAREIVTKLDA